MKFLNWSSKPGHSPFPLFFSFSFYHCSTNLDSLPLANCSMQLAQIRNHKILFEIPKWGRGFTHNLQVEIEMGSQNPITPRVFTR